MNFEYSRICCGASRVSCGASKIYWGILLRMLQILSKNTKKWWFKITITINHHSLYIWYTICYMQKWWIVVYFTFLSRKIFHWHLFEHRKTRKKQIFIREFRVFRCDWDGNYSLNSNYSLLNSTFVLCANTYPIEVSVVNKWFNS